MGKLKRCLAGFLAVATVLSSSNIAYAAGFNEAKTEYTTSLAEAMAAHYELSDEEADLFASDVINTGSLPNAEVPTSELVEVDSVNKLVVATAFEKDGYKWEPVSLKTVYNAGTEKEDVKETIGFGKTENGKYTSTKSYTAQGAFSIVVTYALKYTVNDAAEQERILSIPKILDDGMAYMDDLADLAGKLGTFQVKIDALEDAKAELVTAFNEKCDSMKATLVDKIEATVLEKVTDTVDAEIENNSVLAPYRAELIQRLYDETIDEFDFTKDINGIVAELTEKYPDEVEDYSEDLKSYNDAVAEYNNVINTLDALIADAEDGFEYYKAINVPAGKKIPFLLQEESKSVVGNNGDLSGKFVIIADYLEKYDPNNSMIDDLVDFIEDLESVRDAKCMLFDTTNQNKVFADVSTVKAWYFEADEKAKDFEDLVIALVNAEKLVASSIKNIQDPLKVATYDVTKNVDAALIKVVVSATAPGMGEDNYTCQELDNASKEIVLAVNLPAEDIAKAVNDAVDELLYGTTSKKGLYEVWKDAGYDVKGVGYEAPVYDDMPTKLEKGDELTYTVTYAPKMYTVTADYMGNKSAAYGTKIRLPKYTGDKQSYDYTVTLTPEEGEESTAYYNQDAVISVEGNLTITRTLVERSVTRFFASLLQKYNSEDEISKTILSSDAVDSPLLSIKYPGSDAIKKVNTMNVEGETIHYVLAPEIESGIAGMTWIPSSIVIMKKDAEGKDVEVPGINVSRTYADTLELDGRTVQFSWVPNNIPYDYVQVEYSLEIKTIIEDNKYVALDRAKLKTYLELPKALLQEVKEHKNILDNKINYIYTEINKDEALSSVMYTSVLSTISGQLHKDYGQKAVAAILRDNTGTTLDLYTYMSEICESVSPVTGQLDVAKYLLNGYNKLIRDEAVELAPYLRLIAEDPNLGAILGEEGIENTRQQIRDFAAKLDGIYDMNLDEEPDTGMEVTGTVLVKDIKDLRKEFITDKEKPSAFTNLINAMVSYIVAENKEPMTSITDEMVNSGVIISGSDTADAPGLGSVNIKVIGPETEAVGKWTFPAGENAGSYVFEKGDVDKLLEIVAETKIAAGMSLDDPATLDIVEGNEKYYEDLYSKPLPVEGTVLDLSETTTFDYTISYEAKDYTISVYADGNVVDEVEFSGTDKLPAVFNLDEMSGDENSVCEYEYTIRELLKDGTTVETTGSVKEISPYTVVNLESLAEEKNTLFIERRVFNKETETLDNIVGALNNAFMQQEDLKDENGKLNVAFVPVMNNQAEAYNGEYHSIVLRITDSAKFDALIPAIGSAMIEIAKNTDYIGFGETDSQSAFLSRDDNGSTQIKMQAMIDMLLNSGLSLNSIAEMIDETGSIKENVEFENLEIKSELIPENAAMGGALVTSGIRFGSEGRTLPFYMTLAANESEMLENIKKLADEIDEYAFIGTEKDEAGKAAIALKATMPDDVYTVYMSVMLMIGAITEDDLGVLDGSGNGIDPTLKGHILALKDELLKDLDLATVNTKVIQDTLNESVYKDKPVDLSKYATVIDTLIKTVDRIIKKLEGAEGGNPSINPTKDEGGVYAFDMEYDIIGLLEGQEKLGEFVGFLGENTKLVIPMSFTVTNIGKDVKAIVLDWGKDSISKLNYVEDVAEALANAQGVTYVYLLQDLGQEAGKDLVVKTDTVLNLNGKTVNRDITADGDAALRIVDSTLDASAVGVVNGIVSGNNVRIAAGKYTEALAEGMIREGYSLVDGTVVSEFYTITEKTTDDEGNVLPVKEVKVELSSQFADIADGNMQTLAVDMISDIIFNVYNWASVSVDGKPIIGANAEDLLGDYTGISGIASKLSDCVNIENTKELVNNIYEKFGNLEVLASYLENGGNIAEFMLETANWGAKAELLDGENGKYIGISLATDHPETRKVTISFKDSNSELAASLREFAQLLTINRKFQFEGIDFVNGGLDIKGTAKLDVLVDLTKNIENSDEKSSDYVTAIAAILAYSLDDETEKEALIKAIVDYENNIYAGALEDAIDKISVRTFINAIKAAKETEFTEILKSLGLKNLLVDAASIEIVYEPILEIVYSLVSAAEKAIDTMENKVEIYDRTLGGVKDIDAQTGVKTYGGDFNRGKIGISARMKLFSENYIPPVDHVVAALEKIPANLKDICQTDEMGNVITGETDHREEYLDIIADARKAYDELSDSLKNYIPKDLYDRLVAAEAFYDNMGVWVASIESIDYTGKAIKPVVHVYDGSKLLKLKTDYTVTYQYNTNAAQEDAGSKSPRVIVKLRKNYSGTIYAYFTINKIDLSRANEIVDASTNQTYAQKVGLVVNDAYATVVSAKDKNKNLKKPAVILNGKTMSTSEFTYTYFDAEGNQVNDCKVAGTYTVRITGNGKNFTAKDENGNATYYDAHQYVATTLISKAAVKKIADQPYKADEPGQNIELDKDTLVLTYGSGSKKFELERGFHYEVVGYSKNDRIGTASVTVRGLGQEDPANPLDGSFTGTRTIKFKIVASDKVTKSMVKMLSTSKEYIGKAIELENTVDYKIVDGYNQDGTENVLEYKKHFDVSYKKNTNKGTATVTFKGIGKYTGTVSKTFKITPAPIANLLMSDPEIEVTYKKGGAKPSSEIILRDANTFSNLKNGKDYTLTFYNTTRVATKNSESGKYEYVNVKEKYLPKVVITGKGNYSGKITLYYTITPANLAEQANIVANDVKLSTSKTNNYKTSFTVKDSNGKKLESKKDYSSSYTYYVWEESLKDGKGDWAVIDTTKLKDTNRFNSKGKIKFVTDKEIADGILMKVEVAGNGKTYQGTVSDEYRIYQTAISSAKVSKIASVVYDKFAQEPKVNVTYKGDTLVEGVDYEITSASYTKNIFVGKATVTIKGIGNFGGTVKKTFYINAYKQSKVSVSSSAVSLMFKLEGNSELSEELVTIYKKGGAKPNNQIVLKYTNPATGSEMSLVEGRDFKLTWYNTTRVANENGNYAVSLSKQPKVKITGLNNFSGSKTVYYTIIKSNLDQSGIAMTVKDVKYAGKDYNYKTSYSVKDVNGKKLTVNTDYEAKYYICETVTTAEGTVSKWTSIKELFGKTITLEDGSTVKITSKGKVALEKGQEVKMKIEATGIKNYVDTVLTDEADSVIFREYKLYR